MTIQWSLIQLQLGMPGKASRKELNCPSNVSYVGVGARRRQKDEAWKMWDMKWATEKG